MEKHRVLCGADRLSDADKLLRGKRIALLTAASGTDKQGVPTYRLISDKYTLSYILAPEHGLRSNMQAGLFGEDELTPDPESGALICNLTSKGHPRLREVIENSDIAVYDIQDVGARYYTYLCNLTQVMRECAAVGIPMLVLDRPNPVGGNAIEGEILRPEFSSFIGEYSIPTRYGMTIGEYARFVNKEYGIGCELFVLECRGWRRSMYYDETDLIYINPSPNIPCVDTMFNYFATGILEATNISEGRGTTRPFDTIGAPFIDGERLYRRMCEHELPGVVFRRVWFTPQFNKHAGQCCEGLYFHVTDREAYKPTLTGMHLLSHLREYPEYEERAEGLCLRFGSKRILGDFNVDEFEKDNAKEILLFRNKILPYLLYEN